jgi:phage repressor protein C with HTH and peptisase S24 domain
MNSVNNIERFRLQKGWSRPILAKKMNTSPQQIERLEKGSRSLRQDWIDRAAEAFGVDAAAIISPVPDGEGLYADQAPTRPAERGEMVTIAQLDLSFSMGPGTDIDHYVEEMPVSFDLDYLRTFTRTAPAKLRLAHGVGESMHPTLLSNDSVWNDTTQRQLSQQDRLWAISLFGAAAIKRLRAIGENRVLVMSDNPHVSDQEVDADSLLIAGRVVRIERDV